MLVRRAEGDGRRDLRVYACSRSVSQRGHRKMSGGGGTKQGKRVGDREEDRREREGKRKRKRKRRNHRQRKREKER